MSRTWPRFARRDSHHGVATLLVAAGFAGGLWATVLANSPIRTFDRARQHGIPLRLWHPGWRFFADPDGFDVASIYRVRTAAGQISGWHAVRENQERRWSHSFVHPAQRERKSHDTAVQSLLKEGRRLPRDMQPHTDWYRLMEAHVRRRVEETWRGVHTAQGFQFAVVQHAGYDEEPGLRVRMVSAYTPLPDRAVCEP